MLSQCVKRPRIFLLKIPASLLANLCTLALRAENASLTTVLVFTSINLAFTLHVRLEWKSQCDLSSRGRISIRYWRCLQRFLVRHFISRLFCRISLAVLKLEIGEPMVVL